MSNEAPLPPVPAPRPAVTPAERLLAERIFLLADAWGLRVPAGLDPHHGGLAVCGGRTDPFTKIARLRQAGYSGPLVGDPARYTSHVATTDAPFVHGDDDLFTSGLHRSLNDQIGRGATVALTPTGYLRAEDRATLRAIVEAAEYLDRTDTVVVVPADVGWLADPHVDLFTTALAAIPHPVALALGGQFNPLDRHHRATANLRRLLVTVPGVAPWRTDFAAFDGVAHGAPFAAMGATTGLRHTVPPGAKAQTAREGGGPVPPTVLFPELLRFTSGPALATRYANQKPPTCRCQVCRGAPLTRFDGYTADVRAEADAHNAAAWNELLPALFGEPGLGERQARWKKICVAAYTAHDTENQRLRQKKAFTPPDDLARFAALPVTHAPAPLHTPNR